METRKPVVRECAAQENTRAVPKPSCVGGDTVQTAQSQALWRAAQEFMPGGVNSPVRSFRSVGIDPLFIDRGEGAYVIDADGNRFVDYVLSWGPMILGHAAPPVVEAVARQAERGTSFGAPTAGEVELGRRIVEALPSVERVRLVNSGTEATMSALRLARAATGRDLVVKFAGCYHGHVDSLLVQAGSGAATMGVPDSAGVPAAFASTTLVLPYNDIEAVRTLFTARGQEIAAVIVEPVAANMGVVPPAEGFLAGLRAVTRQYGALLIFDEVITGFRLGYGGAQGYYGIKPDLTCLGKIIGGGMPVGAYGGPAAIMSLVAPTGPVYQAGTLAGNPLATAAGVATLDGLRAEGTYERLASYMGALAEGLRRAARAAGVPVTVNQVGSMLTLFFHPGPVTDWESAARADREKYARFFRSMLAQGIYLPPSQFEAWFASTCHGEAELEATLEAAQKAFREL